VTVIPWYLIPGRPYPLHVYQFASSYYSNHPKTGQRGTAEATRLKFNLKTFSHSTVSRSFRSFEQAQKAALENWYGEEVEITGDGSLVVIDAALKAVDTDSSPDISEKPYSARRFPSTAGTARRREAMAWFLPKFQKDAKTADIEAAGCRFVKDWNEKNRRFLL
jgi:hypothetical protein